jgi:hypothetical protein
VDRTADEMGKVDMVSVTRHLDVAIDNTKKVVKLPSEPSVRFLRQGQGRGRRQPRGRQKSSTRSRGQEGDMMGVSTRMAKEISRSRGQVDLTLETTKGSPVG